MIKDLVNVTKKNFKLVMRSKTSILVLIVAPIIIIYLLGIAFNNTNIYSINVGVYSEEYSGLSESFLEKLGEKFTIIREDSELRCVESIKGGQTHICVVFPPGMSVEPGESANIVFHIDPSKINFVWMILDIISSKVSSQSKEISLNLTSILLGKLQETTAELDEKSALLEELEKENEELIESNNRVKSELEVLDLSVDLNAFNMADLREENSKNIELSEMNNAEFETMKIYISNRVESINEDLDALKDEVGDYDNASGGDMVSLISEIEDDLDEASERLNETNLTNFDAGSMSSLIDDIGLKLSGLGKRMEKAGEFKDSALVDLESSSQKLNSSLNRVKELKLSFEDMKYNINSIRITEAGSIVSPISTTIKQIVPEKTHLNYIFAGLIALIIMFVSMLLSSTIVLMEKKSKSYLINYLAPTNDFVYVISIYITTMVLMVFQLIIILGISTYFYSSQIIPNILPISAILLISTSLFVLVGMVIAYVFRAEQTITLVTVSLGTLLLFLSDLILPIESMPVFFRNIAMFNPFLVSELALKKTILFGANFWGVISDMKILIAYCLIAFIIILLVENLIKRHTLLRLFRWLRPFKKG